MLLKTLLNKVLTKENPSKLLKCFFEDYDVKEYGSLLLTFFCATCCIFLVVTSCATEAVKLGSQESNPLMSNYCATKKPDRQCLDGNNGKSPQPYETNC